jgi:hypothetical protein
MIEMLVKHNIENFFEAKTRDQIDTLRSFFTEDWEKASDEELTEFCIDYNFIEENQNA